MGPHTGRSPEVIVRTSELDAIVDWQPEDLTMVVQAGVTVAEIEAKLAAHDQTAVLPEMDGEATIGGVIASGASGYRRLRYGPTRERVLETVLATGDGRVVRSGARVVKNVTGYDIPRLVTGSLGSLGVIGEVCLKLWPAPQTRATLEMDVAGFGELYRPMALLETEAGSFAYLGGTPDEVAGQAQAVGATPSEGFQWPQPVETPVVLEFRVPPSHTAGAARQAADAGATLWRAQHGVGVVTAGFEAWSAERLGALRAWAATVRGAVVVNRAPDDVGDRWGATPATVELQRKVKAAFDPRGVMVPGRLPGDI